MANEAATSMLSGKRVLLAMLGIIMIAVAVLAFAYVRREPDPQLPDLGTVPAFSLVDESGAPFTEEALRGHPTIVDFVFTRCDAICPTLSGRMQRLQEKTADRKGQAIKLLSISIDPAYDTPDKLAPYAQRFAADPTRWRFLTGPADKVTQLVTGGFMTAMDRDGTTRSGAPSIAHRGYFLLVDGDLVIRGIYESDEPTRLDELVHHARFLARTGGDRQYKFGGS